MLSFAYKVLNAIGSPNSTYQRPALEEFVSLNKNIEETLHFSGIVTSVDSFGGVIDNKIYFDVSIIPKNIDIFIGLTVQGIAARYSEADAWKAVKLDLENTSWDENVESDPNLLTERKIVNFGNYIIGKVISVSGSFVYLNCLVHFKVNEEICKFSIEVGDFISCTRLTGDVLPQTSANNNGRSEDIKMKQVVPLRIKKLKGTVTHSCTKYIIIDNSVFCDVRLVKPYGADYGDAVLAEVIESEQGEFFWRALSCTVLPQIPSHLEYESKANNFIKDFTPAFGFKLAAKNGIEVSGHWDFGEVTLESTKLLEVTVKNDSELLKHIKNVYFLSSKSASQFKAEIVGGIRFPCRLDEKNSINILLSCNGHYLGYHKQLCIFDFDNFKLSQAVTANVVHNAERALCDYSNKFSRHEKSKVYNPNAFKGFKVIRGERSFRVPKFIPVSIPQFNVPDKLYDIVTNNVNLSDEYAVLSETLSEANYKEKFMLLLHLEEIEMTLQMEMFNIPRVKFDYHGEFLSLSVPGLAEKRPSVLIGDYVLAGTPCDFLSDASDIYYEGCVHDVLCKKILLKFHPSFQCKYGEEDCSVKFRFNRTPLRRCHFAVSFAFKQLGPEILFPKKLHIQVPQVAYIDLEFVPIHSQFLLKSKPVRILPPLSEHNVTNYAQNNTFLPRSVEIQYGSKCLAKNKTMSRNSFKNGRNEMSFSVNNKQNKEYYVPVIKNMSSATPNGAVKLHWFNKALNLEQKTAVKRILDGTTRPIPYIIYGPPGTGKTITIVEAVLQIFVHVSDSRILIVAPSNSASDLLTEHLIESKQVDVGHLIRLNSFQRSVDGVPDKIRMFCCTTDQMETHILKKIIIATVTTSGFLYSMGLCNGHFSHVILDEAGQMTEPETCIALGLVNKFDGQIIMAGDPEQLGPVVHSQICKKYGLQESLLHRLCSSVLYKPHIDANTASAVYEPRLVTQLLRSYRCHPDILAVPSMLFYNNALKSCPSERQNKLLEWEDLPNNTCPILFHGIVSENRQEADSPSWFNPSEAFQVVCYTKSLTDFGIKARDIGIITPYRKQVKIGTVEEFQGQERLVVIISTVRSTISCVQNDMRHSLGFVNCRKRFNVAITRAQALLVVVGNPILLREDPCWREFIMFCLEKEAYIGPDLFLE